MYDLHYNISQVRPLPLTGRGFDYLRSHPGDYHQAIDAGLQVSFEDKATFDQLSNLNTDTEWQPIAMPVNSGYNDSIPFDDCDSDDNVDERLCEKVGV